MEKLKYITRNSDYFRAVIIKWVCTADVTLDDIYETHAEESDLSSSGQTANKVRYQALVDSTKKKQTNGAGEIQESLSTNHVFSEKTFNMRDSSSKKDNLTRKYPLIHLWLLVAMKNFFLLD